MWQISGLYTSTGIIRNPVHSIGADRLLEGESQGFAIDATVINTSPRYTGAPDGGYVSVKDTNTPANNLSNVAMDLSILVQSGTSPKMVLWNSAPYVRWTPHNYCLQSQTLGTTWASTAVSVSANSTTAPDGTSTADTITADGTSAVHVHYQSVSPPPNADEVVTFSVYLKANTHNYVNVIFTTNNASSKYFCAVADLSNGTINQTDSGGVGTNFVGSAITSVGSGWYRVSITGSLSFTSLISIELNFAGAASGNDTTSNGWGEISNSSSGSFYAWGAQLNRGPIALPYLVTTTAARIGIPQAYRSPGEYGMLVEPAATNLVLRSQEIDNAAWAYNNATVTANSTVAPDGSTTADTLTASAGNSLHSAFPAAALTTVATSNYTASAYLKAGTNQYASVVFASFATANAWVRATADLTNGTITQTDAGAGATYVSSAITSIGNGWYRVSVTGSLAVAVDGIITINMNNTGTPSSANFGETSFNAAGTETIIVWGAQVELGSVATSYIPTVAATATRAIDTVTAACSSIPYSTTECSVYADVKSLFLDSAGPAFWEISADNSNLYGVYDNNGAPTIFNIDGAVTNVNSALGTMTVNTRTQLSAAFKTNDFDGSQDGAAIVSDGAGTMDATAGSGMTFRLGHDITGATISITGYIRRLIYVPRQVQTDSANLATWRYNA